MRLHIFNIQFAAARFNCRVLATLTQGRHYVNKSLTAATSSDSRLSHSRAFRMGLRAGLGYVRYYCRRMSTHPVENAIKEKLTTRLEAAHVEVVNESHMHNVPEDAETHFKVLIVSHEFDGLPLLRRHRLVNEILEYELKHGVHALSIITKTPDQWIDNQPIDPSPPCRGGFGK